MDDVRRCNPGRGDDGAMPWEEDGRWERSSSSNFWDEARRRAAAAAAAERFEAEELLRESNALDAARVAGLDCIHTPSQHNCQVMQKEH